MAISWKRGAVTVHGDVSKLPQIKGHDTDLLTRMVAGYEQHQGDATSYLVREFQQHPETAIDAVRLAEAIHDSVETVDQLHRELSRFKREQGTREQWLWSALPPAAILEATQALAGANGNLTDTILGHSEALAAPTGLTHALRTAVDLGNLTTAATLQEAIAAPLGELPLVRAAVESDFSSIEERTLTKILAAGAVIGQQTGLMPVPAGAGPAEVALMVDRSVETVKAFYHFGVGRLAWPDLVERLVDRAAAAIVTVARKVIIGAAEGIGATVGGAIGAIFGPAGQVIGATVGRFIGRVVGESVSRKLEKAVTWVAAKAKQVLSAVADRASRVWEKLKESRLNPINWS